MHRLIGVVAVALPLFAAVVPARAQGSVPSQTPSSLGRYQLVVVPNHAGSPFLVDSATGCVWHLIQNQETKRSTFVEVDVENLHWSWGSGTQQLLAARVDASNLPEDQKRALKQEVQRTGCGLSPVVLTPPMPEPSPRR